MKRETVAYELSLPALLVAMLIFPMSPVIGLSTTDDSAVVIGRSVEGRPIIARRFGEDSGIPVLVVGTIHGNERSGLQITRALVESPVPNGFTLWVIDDLNPDGAVLATRQNSRGVDLNRNFPVRWRKITCPSKFCSGRRPASEPETSAFVDFFDRVKPVVTVFYHSVGNIVDLPKEGLREVRALRVYAKRAQLPIAAVSCGSDGCTGNATQFANESRPDGTAFVVELPCDDRCLSRRTVRRHVEAFWAAARSAAD